MRKCPICSKPVAPRAQNGAVPFCSDRCKLIDLGKWLGEQYRVPVVEREDEASSDGSVSQPAHEREEPAEEPSTKN